MNRREAKRMASAWLAEAAMQAAVEMTPPTPDDALRVEAACLEFAEELYRRAGLDACAQAVDERQLSIYDELESINLDGTQHLDGTQRPMTDPEEET